MEGCAGQRRGRRAAAERWMRGGEQSAGATEANAQRKKRVGWRAQGSLAANLEGPLLGFALLLGLAHGQLVAHARVGVGERALPARQNAVEVPHEPLGERRRGQVERRLPVPVLDLRRSKRATRARCQSTLRDVKPWLPEVPHVNVGCSFTVTEAPRATRRRALLRFFQRQAMWSGESPLRAGRSTLGQSSGGGGGERGGGGREQHVLVWSEPEEEARGSSEEEEARGEEMRRDI